ncbi:MAG: DMT family protein [Paludibacteraceae bacterium]|nr:DMT family protein [Paludibacteraceae bacterium]
MKTDIIFSLIYIKNIILVVFVAFSSLFFKTETFRWNHAIGFMFLVLAVYFIFKK